MTEPHGGIVKETMKPIHRLAGPVAGILVATSLCAQYATTVVDYIPGAGFSTTRTNAIAALGEPSRDTPGDFGGPVDPFAPPYTATQLVSVGTGGSLTVGFANPIRNDPANPYGIDFNVFGGGGFLVTNALDVDFIYIGVPSTDGTLFNPNGGSTRVSVSPDGSNWYALDPALAPKVDDLFPTDGSGDFTLPVPPSLRSESLSGLTLADLRMRYAGSAGGAGFDLGWARATGGGPVSLESVSFVRIEVLSGRSEIDGFAAVGAVPEPSTIALFAVGALACLGFQRHC
jgi:hypothetical protein